MHEPKHGTHQSLWYCHSEKDGVMEFGFGTEGGTRTRTDLVNPKDFKSFASTNSATPAQTE